MLLCRHQSKALLVQHAAKIKAGLVQRVTRLGK
jgi:hypothetical protein